MSDFSIGEKFKVTLFGQSHGPAIGCVMEGFPAGQKINWDFITAFMARRAPGQNAWSTPRKEADQPEVLSGLNADGLTCVGRARRRAVLRPADRPAVLCRGPGKAVLGR